MTGIMDEKKEEEFKADLKKRYGNEFFGFLATVSESNYYDYRNLCDAIMWLRFWGEKGHGMNAWY